MIRFVKVMGPVLALAAFACGIKGPRQSGAEELRASPVAAAMLTSSDLRNVPVAQVGDEARAAPPATPQKENEAEAPAPSDEIAEASPAVVDLGDIDDPNSSPVIELDETAQDKAVVDLGEIDDREPETSKAKTPPKAELKY